MLDGFENRYSTTAIGNNLNPEMTMMWVVLMH
jgi:hypothetical protein